MGSVLTYVTGDRFMVRHFANLGSISGPQWSNTVELKAEGAGALADLKVLAGHMLAIYKAMTSSDVTFARYTISTWLAEGVPYDPEEFYSEDLTGQTGLRTVPDMLDLGVCLLLSRNAAVGRTGRIWLRGALGEADVEVDAGRFKLTDPATMASTLAGVLTSTNLSQHFAGGSDTLKLAMLGARQELGVWNYWESIWTGLTVKGVSILPTKHRWYNQTR